MRTILKGRSASGVSGLRVAAAAASVLLAAFAAPSFGQPYSDIDRLVIFGTSLSDPGNFFVRVSRQPDCGTRQLVPPYSALLKDPSTPLVPDGPYARGGHHVSNGATWAEGFAQSLALAGDARPALRTDGGKAGNYAVLGARAIPADAANPCAFNLPQQVGAYLADFPQATARSLFVIEVGSNDVRDALFLLATAGQAQAEQRIGAAVGSLVNQIATLYQAGARKFLLLNVPDIGKTPSVRMLDAAFPGIAAGATALSMGYNAAFDGAVVPFAMSLPGVQVRKLDIFAKLNAVIATPAAFNLANVSEPCVMPNVPPYECAHPDTYLFWDGIHPTKAMHAIIAQEAIKVTFTP